MTRYIVANHDRNGQVVEVFPIIEFLNIHGKHTANVEEAVSCVAQDGSCHHAFDLNVVPIYPVH